MNLSVLSGRLTKDVEIKYTPTGTAVVKFNLAVNRDFAKEGQQQADFVSCIAFNKTAELLSQYCSKGSKIGVQGRIQTGSYEKDGQKVYTTDVVVDRIEFLDTKQSGEQSSAPAPKKNEPFGPGKQYTGADDEDIDLDLPF